MRAYRRERLENAIAYIIKIHTHLAQKPAAQTYIYKYLALIDFRAIEETGSPVFDLDYIALRNGPVPANLYDIREDIVNDDSFFEKIALESNPEGNYIFIQKGEPDLDWLSDYEIDLIESTVEEFANPYVTTKDLIDATHERIKAWGFAWRNRIDSERVPINPIHTFSDLDRKKVEELTSSEEVALVHNALKTESSRRDLWK